MITKEGECCLNLAGRKNKKVSEGTRVEYKNKLAYYIGLF